MVGISVVFGVVLGREPGVEGVPPHEIEMEVMSVMIVTAMRTAFFILIYCTL